MKENSLFQETQKFRQWWLWSLLGIPAILVIVQVLFFIIQDFNSESGNSSFSIIMPYGFWIGFLIWLFAIIFFLRIKLETIITKDTIKISYLLFVNMTFKIVDIRKAEIVTYSFVGFGIRLSSKRGTLFHVKGNKGLSLILNHGKKYMIGTQRPAELRSVVEKILS